MAFSIDLPARSVRNGDTVALRGDNGLFLSKINEFYLDFKKELIDKFCIFEIEISPDYGDRIALKGENGMYMSYIYKDSEDYVWLAKSRIDEFCVFRPHVLYDRGMVALEASNKKYVSRINQYDVRASKPLPDRFCYFDLVSDPHVEGGRYA